MFEVGFFVWWYINFCGLFNAKAILVKQQWYYLPHCRGDKDVHTFPKGFSLKVNVIVWLELEPIVHHLSHYTIKTTPHKRSYSLKFYSMGMKTKVF